MSKCWFGFTDWIRLNRSRKSNGSNWKSSQKYHSGIFLISITWKVARTLMDRVDLVRTARTLFIQVFSEIVKSYFIIYLSTKLHLHCWKSQIWRSPKSLVQNLNFGHAFYHQRFLIGLMLTNQSTSPLQIFVRSLKPGSKLQKKLYYVFYLLNWSAPPEGKIWVHSEQVLKLRLFLHHVMLPRNDSYFIRRAYQAETVLSDNRRGLGSSKGPVDDLKARPWPRKGYLSRNPKMELFRHRLSQNRAYQPDNHVIRSIFNFRLTKSARGPV